ncbi:hypothetical protein [Polaribacter sp. HaHaR_3_91]|uniref:hypothetical protein n=1 Tax=Polaribacter sp. HaHaR_3_91 TaxID=2745561 RepID=UPI001C4F0974|nr:hypothetical protein [Polaribacter sp. HaHaR_3_91]QXP63254.1 hypothetical protein H0I27_15605 [Polaribacter sp. HaHaR_3_91]
MNFFPTLLQNRNLKKHDGRPFWKYLLTSEELIELKKTFQYTSRYNLDPRDVALYYAQWWKRNYNGGIPSKQEVFESLEGNIRVYFTPQEFYKTARKGAELLGVKWIKKQNTLYFKSLLLQGGLPLTHISKNHGAYKNFLLAVLEEQPETVDDIVYMPHIIKYLPKSSQNDIIYENCFEIVKSILDNDDTYDELLGTSESLKEISRALKIRSNSLIKKERISKPKNYWLLRFKNDTIEINLRVGLLPKYTSTALANILGFEKLNSRKYELFINDELICVFQKLSNGYYKTDWFQQQDQKWDFESNLPHTYIIEEDGHKVEVNDFIQIVPNRHQPSLWSRYSANEWRLIKGNGTSNNEAAVLFPEDWNSDIKPQTINFYDNTMSWLEFEGKVELSNTLETRRYLSDVSSFDWTVISQKPNWILKANMPIVNKKPKVIVYDENNNILEARKYKVSIKKHKSYKGWQELNTARILEEGCIDLKIERNGLVAYDTIYNLGNLRFRYTSKSISKSNIIVENKGSFEIELKEDDILKIEKNQLGFALNVNTKFSKVPKGVYGSLRYENEKRLFFELASPLEGIALLDKEGGIISTDAKLTISDLYGLRILSAANSETILKIKNKFKEDVIITKEIKSSSQPLITFINEIKRLYYLEDAMNHHNKVRIELIEGRTSRIYEVSGFSYNLNVDEQFDRKVTVEPSIHAPDLFAIPLNDNSLDMELIPLVKNESNYELPATEEAKQFIVISSKSELKRLMPRYVNTDENFEGLDKLERIELYSNRLLESGFTNSLWTQLVSCFKICIDHEIPFSTFDQLRAISRNSEVAAKAFFLIGRNQFDTDEYIQKSIPEMEKDLGFCFHWIQKEHWDSALNVLNEEFGIEHYIRNLGLLKSYMEFNDLQEVLNYVTGNNINPKKITYSQIMNLRASLGVRVLRELPYGSPKINSQRNIPINEHKPIKLLLNAPIAVAESINNLQDKTSIWGGDEFREMIRRNIQYSQYINQTFYNKLLAYALKNS